MQTPKSILLHLDNSSGTPARVALALRLAESLDAEVAGVFAVNPYKLPVPMSIEGGAAALTVLGRADQEARDAAQTMFAAASAGSPLMHWSDAGQDPLPEFRRRAFYCDLMVLGQRNPDERAATEIPPDFLTDLVIDTGKPALIVPYTGGHVTVGGTVLVAWKESREAARALTAALPWVHNARQVHVVSYGDEGDVLSHDLRPYLLARGIDAKLHRDVSDSGPIGERLLSLAADLSADLLVMGCYGHSRAREWVLGGATRTILEAMTVPVLMAH